MVSNIPLFFYTNWTTEPFHEVSAMFSFDSSARDTMISAAVLPVTANNK